MTKATTTFEQTNGAAKAAFGDAVQQTLTTFSGVSADGSKNLEALMASANAATKGFEALRAQVASYSQAALQNQWTAVSQLASASSPQNAVELQTAFAKNALESYLAGVASWSETLSATVRDTMQPLTDRAAASFERLQASR